MARRNSLYCYRHSASLQLAIILLTLFGFAPVASSQGVTVFAAASLKNALDDIDAAYRRAGGPRTVASYLASSALAHQIEKGAPADVFISADLEWMDYLDKRRLLKPGSRTNLLRNELVLVAPAASKAALNVAPGFPLAIQLGDRRLAIADPDHVPAGKYAKAALQTLGVWPSVAGKLARAENARAALLFVSRGEAPFGIVYRTDAAADRNVRVVSAFPPNSHPLIVYPAALLVASRNPAADRYFVFLTSDDAAAIFSRHGFIPYRRP
ncbi:MAG TPA: molybdate ABC transporter substrate-binding protein [Burkholderiales bacterium]|nr:molybdate ABC transporter substrate-binding protein [Burkholderiales bacterium]